MALLVGRVDEYNDAKEDFESYLERLEQWMLANEIVESCVFLSVIGADANKLLKNLVSPTVPNTMVYDDLIGHIARACRKGKAISQIQYVEAEVNKSRVDEEAELFGLYAVYSTSRYEEGYTVDEQQCYWIQGQLCQWNLRISTRRI
ncbi:uncharacterized protein K02A2.6-like [Tachysurus ichikawai]